MRRSLSLFPTLPQGRWSSFLVLAVLPLALVACGEQKQAAKPPTQLVRVAKAEPKPFASAATLTGEIAARIQSDLSFRVSGRISERLVDVGAHVEKGQLLARLDPTQQDADVRSAMASVASAEAQVRQSAAAFERQKSLLGDGFTTRRDFDQAERAQRVAQASFETAKAQLVIAQNALSYTELKADAAGIITARNADTGEVAQSAQVIFTLAQDGPRDAVFEVNESLLLASSDNLEIQVSMVRDPQVRTSGLVRQVSPTVNSRSGTVRVKIGLNQPPPAMTLGSVVSGTGNMKAVDAVTLPWASLSSVDGRPAVWVFDPQSSKVSLRPVKVAQHETSQVVILSGLARDEMVVTDGTRLLKPGQTVEVIKE